MCEQLFGQEENARKMQCTNITWVLNSRDEDTFNTSKTSVKCKAVHIDSGDTVWDIARE